MEEAISRGLGRFPEILKFCSERPKVDDLVDWVDQTHVVMDETLACANIRDGSSQLRDAGCFSPTTELGQFRGRFVSLQAIKDLEITGRWVAFRDAAAEAPDLFELEMVS